MPVKDLREKVVTTKRFEYSSLGTELEEQTDIAERQTDMIKKQYRGLDTVNEFSKTLVNKTSEN